MKLAFVTGSNKGIGFALVEKLARHLDTVNEWDVFITARNQDLGQSSVEELKKKGLYVKFHQLDITETESRNSFVRFVRKSYPLGINIAVNNAGIAFQVRAAMNTNFISTLNFTTEILPVLAEHSRVVHLCSLLSFSTLKKLDRKLYSLFTSSMTLKELTDLADDFMRHADLGDHECYGWPTFAYGVSKLFLTKGSYILGDLIKNDPRHIIMNSCCPGYVKTDMTNHKGTKSPEEGADTPFYLATLPVGVTEPVNEFVCNRRIKHWPKAS